MLVQPTVTQNRIAESQSTKRKTNERRRFGDRRRKNVPIRFADRRSSADRRSIRAQKKPKENPEPRNSENRNYEDDSSVGQNIDLRV